MAEARAMAKREIPADTVQERPRGGRARAVAEIVPDVGRAAFRRFGFVQSSVVSRWADIVGPRHARYSAPESIRFPHGKRADGTLTIIVSGAHAPMMQHAVPAIIDRVNRFFGYGAVAKVTIRQGALPTPPAARPARPEVEVPKELGDSLRTIGDPELKAVLESLALSVTQAGAMPIKIGKIS